MPATGLVYPDHLRARVILVAPHIRLGDPRKYVVKICLKSTSKLRKEIEQFRTFVELWWIEGQHMTADWGESARYEAIRYPFASADTMCSSTSFSKKYREGANLDLLQQIVSNIFNHNLFRKWREKYTVKHRKTVSAAFQQVLNIEASENALDQLLSPEFSTAINLDRAQLKVVLNTEVEFLECPNHGDLHSDNVQVQDASSNVFLIDFGLTGIYPAGLDYAALETSIRFRLLDYSVDPRILFSLDAGPLEKFDSLIRPGEPAKGEVDKALKLCSMIRQRFLNDFSEKGNIQNLKRQYLCCLLVICLRQIKYPNMNRRYILQMMSQILPPLYRELIV